MSVPSVLSTGKQFTCDVWVYFLLDDYVDVKQSSQTGLKQGGGIWETREAVPDRRRSTASFKFNFVRGNRTGSGGFGNVNWPLRRGRYWFGAVGLHSSVDCSELVFTYASTSRFAFCAASDNTGSLSSSRSSASDAVSTLGDGDVVSGNTAGTDVSPEERSPELLDVPSTAFVCVCEARG